MTAYCNKCRKTYGTKVNAPFTVRLTEEKETIIPGGKDKYMAMCRYHYEEHNNNK